LNPRMSGEMAQAADTLKNVAVAVPTGPAKVEFDIVSGYNPLPDAKSTGGAR